MSPFSLAIVASALPLLLSDPASEKQGKVLMIFIDGFIPESIAITDTPNLKRLMANGAWSLDARAESTTISGSGWSTFLTGVHWDKHGVPDNEFEHPSYERYKHIIQLLEEARPGAVTASAVTWEPIESKLAAPAGATHHIFHDYDAYSSDYFDEPSCDALATKDLGVALRDPKLELAIMMFGELDGVGHSDSNLHYDAWDALYQKKLEQTDAWIGELLAAVAARSTKKSEDWLVLVSADHAGSMHLGHGRNIPEHRRIPLIVSGSSVAKGEIWPPPQPADLVPTALAHLGVEIRPAWDLDGIVLGGSKSARPRPELGVNLLFNGDAELERGFAGTTGVPDASIAGWNDPGALTVVAYGSADGFPARDDVLPPLPGKSFFAGGDVETVTYAEQTIDLLAVSSAIDFGIRYELSAWLGGYAAQDDAATLSVTWLDGAGAILARGVLAPVWASERGEKTGFVERRLVGDVPRGARAVRVRVDMLAHEGKNDGYADDLSLVLRKR